MSDSSNTATIPKKVRLFYDKEQEAVTAGKSPEEAEKALDELDKKREEKAAALRVINQDSHTTQPANVTVPEPNEQKEQYICTRMSEVTARPIEWMWPGVFAYGKPVMVSGDPGLGKSQATINITAIVTTGGKFPLSDHVVEPGDALLITGEDDPADTIRPRLEAAGADLSRVYILEAVREGIKRRSLSLDRDIQILTDLLSNNEKIKLIVIDPITAYLGDINSHNNAEVRALLTPLQELAAKFHVCIICVSHLNKGGGKATINRFAGSLAFVAAVRAAYLVTRDSSDPNKRLFLPAKNNIGDDKRGYSFTVNTVKLDNEIETSKVVWGDDFIYESADDIMSQQEDREGTGAIKDAIGFLRALLCDGPVLSKKIQNEARDAGHSWATVKRAQQVLQIVPYKQTGPSGKWVWELPQDQRDEVPYD